MAEFLRVNSLLDEQKKEHFREKCMLTMCKGQKKPAVLSVTEGEDESGETRG